MSNTTTIISFRITEDGYCEFYSTLYSKWIPCVRETYCKSEQCSTRNKELERLERMR